MLPEGTAARIRTDSYEIPPIFGMLQQDGNIAKDMMYNTYNMGIGMMLVVDAADADQTVDLIEKSGQKGYLVGEIISGNREVVLQ